MRKRNRNRFLKALLKYSFCVLILIGILMSILYLYLEKYEQSQLSYAIKEYTTKLEKEKMDDALDVLLEQLNTTIQSKEDVEKNFSDVVEHIEFHKDVSNTNEKQVSYTLSYNGNTIGSVTFAKSDGHNLFGLPIWKVKKESLDFTSMIIGKTIHCVDEWSIYVNDQLLDETYVTNTGIPFTGLEQFYYEGNPLGFPTMKEYSIPNIIGEVSVKIVSPAGVELSEESIKGSTFLDGVFEEDQTKVNSFIPSFLSAYVQCLSNANHDETANFENIKPYLVENGVLYNRLQEAIAGMAWANSAGDTLLNVNVNGISNFGGGYLLADVSYTVDTIGTEGAVQSTYNLIVLLQNKEDSFVVYDLAKY